MVDPLTSEEPAIPFPSYERWCTFRRGLETDAAEYRRQKEWTGRFVKHRACEHCKEPFSDANVMTPDGWKETQISGICEKCFDSICEESACE